MPRGRGGARQGTPGKGYANRTDLMGNYNESKDTAATGGLTAPNVENPANTGGVAPQAGPGTNMATYQGPTPEDSPNLSDPTQYPDQPVTDGLSLGPGAGPSRDTRLADTVGLKKFLPLMEPYLTHPETPDSVRMLFRYIRGA